MQTVGFIGVGNIGRPMAECVVKAGFEVTVCDAFEAARQAFTSRGIRATARPADLGTCDMVIVMVATDSQAKEVLLGADGVIQGIDPKRPPLVAVMSTVLPETIKALAAALGARGSRVVDAPVSGGAVKAAEGSLTIMQGGADADLAAAQPVFRAMATNILSCGPLGSGEAVKIVNNVLGVSTIFLTVEAMQIATRMGIDPARMAEIMEKSSGRNSATQDWNRYAQMLKLYGSELRATKANTDVCRKDISHAAALGRDLGLPVPFIEAISSTAQAASYEDLMQRWSELGKTAK